MSDENVKRLKEESKRAGFEQLVEGVDKFLAPDDLVPYDGEKCITECGGQCCVNIAVSVDPYSVYAIVASQEGKRAGIDSTKKLFGVLTGVELLKLYLGERSGFPQVTINFTRMSRTFSACPFLAPVLVAKSPEDVAAIQSRDLGKIATLERKVAKSGFPNMLCVLQKVKPTICRASPLGHVVEFNTDTGKPEDFYFYKPPHPDCACVKTDRRVSLKDYIAEWDLERRYKYSYLAREVLAKAMKMNKGYRFLVGCFIYNFNLFTDETPPSFDVLLDRTRKYIEKLRNLRGNFTPDRLPELHRLGKDAMAGH